MKKTVAILLLFAQILTFAVSCGKTIPAETDKQTDTETQTETVTEQKENENVKELLASYNYIIGTQAFSPLYQFTDKTPLSEITGRIVQMGSNMVKFYATDDNMITTLHEEYPEIKTVFMWYRSDPIFQDGLSESESQDEYNAFYKYAKKLLTEFNGTGMTFYLGHWEGDWYYLQGSDVSIKAVSNTLTQGMIGWINIRQKAVDDAKRDFPDTDVKLWNYIELNRPSDARKLKYDRVVNKVLPYTNVDYVSYSAYDVMSESKAEIKKTVDYIYSCLPDKEGVPGDRVFIGEFGWPAANVGYNDSKHCEENLKMIAKFLSCDVKYVLIWQMYDNEWSNEKRKQCRGFWLINQNNEETLLYQAIESLLSQGKEYVRNFYEKNGTLPSEKEYSAFLLTTNELKGKA